MSVRPGQTQRQGEGKGGKYLVSGAGEKLLKEEENVWRKKQTRFSEEEEEYGWKKEQNIRRRKK